MTEPDITKRLRNVALFSKSDWQDDVALCRVAADEIDRLRERNARLLEPLEEILEIIDRLTIHNYHILPDALMESGWFKRTRAAIAVEKKGQP